MNTIKIVYTGNLPAGNLVDNRKPETPKEYPFKAGEPLEVPEEFGRFTVDGSAFWKMVDQVKAKG